MNPNRRIHKDLVVENRQDLQLDKKQSLTLNQPGSEMSNRELAARCGSEIKNFSLGKPNTGKYSLELLRRATMQGDKEAWVCIKQCFSELVLSWLRLHPNWEAVCELDKEEYCVARTFERFWQATAFIQHIEFNSLTGALHFLRACLNGVMLDSQRTYVRSKAIPLQGPVQPGEWQNEDNFESNDVWDTLKKVIPNGNERRLAYLLFHCGLKPRQIMRVCPQEYSDIHDIYCLRNNMMNRIAQIADL